MVAVVVIVEVTIWPGMDHMHSLLLRQELRCMCESELEELTL